MDSLTPSAIRRAVQQLKEAASRHDYVDTDGNYRFDRATKKLFCWKHGDWE